MNCTQQEFEDEIRVYYPHKWLSKEHVPGPFGVSETIYILDTAGETALPYGTQASLASHIWKDGVVIKDSTGVFSRQQFNIVPGSVPGSFTFNIPAVPVGGYYYTGGSAKSSNTPDTAEKQQNSLKCICGAHSVGSNGHSSWCDLNEVLNVVT